MEFFTVNQKTESKTNDLWVYCLIAYAVSWLMWLPAILSNYGIIDPLWHFKFTIGVTSISLWGTLGSFGPMVAAFSLTYLKEGIDGVKKLFKRGGEYKFRKIWWIAVFSLPAAQGLILLLAIILGAQTPVIWWLSQPWFFSFQFILISFVFWGPLGEEFGWRGYALDRLQSRWNASVSSVLLGVIHACWHIPLWFADSSRGGLFEFLFFMAMLILLTVTITWIYNNTNGSILVAMIVHLLANLAIFATNVGLAGLFYIIYAVTATVAILVIFGYRTLVRGKRDFTEESSISTS